MNTITFNNKTRVLPKNVQFMGWERHMAVFLYLHPFLKRSFRIYEMDGAYLASEAIPTGTRTITLPSGEKETFEDKELWWVKNSPNNFHIGLAKLGIDPQTVDYRERGMMIGRDSFSSLAECKSALDEFASRDEWYSALRPMDDREKAIYKLIDARWRLWMSHSFKSIMDKSGYGGDSWLSGISTFAKMEPSDPRQKTLDAYLANPSADAWDNLKRMRITVIGSFGDAWAQAGGSGFPTAEELQTTVRADVRSEYEGHTRDIARYSELLQKLVAA